MKGYRTIAFNVLSIVVISAGALLQYIGDLPLTDTQAGIAGFMATIVVNVGNMYLRTKTTTPMGKRS